MTTLVYRVEHPTTGEGPYMTGGWPGRIDMRWAHNDDRHPAPFGDPALGGIWHFEQCGCDSPKSLLAWFKDFWEGLDEGGFYVRVFEVEDARVGTHGQVVFNPETAIPRGRFNCAGFVRWFTRY